MAGRIAAEGIIAGVGITNPIGAALITTVGAGADTFLFSSLLGDREQTQPNLDGQNLTLGAEGRPIIRCWGGAPRVLTDIDGFRGTGLRIPGSVIWAARPILEANAGVSKRGAVTPAKVSRTLQLALCRNPIDDLIGIQRIHSNSGVVFDNTPDTEIFISVHNVDGSGDFFLDYESRWSVTQDAQGRFEVDYSLVIRNGILGGNPLATGAADPKLDVFVPGELVFVRLQDPTGDQASRQWHYNPTGGGFPIPIGNGAIEVPYLVTHSERFADGRSELILELARGFSQPNNEGGLVGSNENAWIPTLVEDRPNPFQQDLWNVISTSRASPPNQLRPFQISTPGSRVLQIRTARTRWQPNTFLVANPQEGTDYQLQNAQNPGAQSTIVFGATLDGLGADTPHNADLTVFNFDRLNQSELGNVLGNIEFEVVEGLLCSTWQMLSELYSLSGVPPSRIRPQRGTGLIDDFVRSFGEQHPNSPRNLTNGTIERAERGASRIRVNHTGSSAPIPLGAAMVFRQPGMTEDDERDGQTTFYRCRIVQQSVTAGQWIVEFTPKLTQNHTGFGEQVYFWDTSGATDNANNVDGFILTGLSNIESAIGQLEVAGDIRNREQDGVLELFPYSQPHTEVIPNRFLDARPSRRTLPRDPLRLRDPIADIRRVEVTFRNVSNDGLIGEDESLNPSPTDSIAASGIEEPYVSSTQPEQVERVSLTDCFIRRAKADEVALRVRTRSQTDRPAQLSLPNKYSYLQEGDRIQPQEPINGVSYSMRVDEIRDTRNGVLELSVVVTSASTETRIGGLSTPENGGVDVPPKGFGSITPASVSLLDIPPILSSQIGQTRIQGVADFAGSSGTSGNALLHVGVNSEDLAEPIESVAITKSIGQASATASNASPSTAVDDFVTVLRVRMNRAELQTVTTAMAHGGANLAVWGSEVIRFINADLQADGSYEITGLLRGRHGTARQMSAHADGPERFVLLSGVRGNYSAFQIDLELGDLGSSVDIAATVAGEDISAARIRTIEPELNMARPHPPERLEWSKGAGSSLSLSWTRNPRREFDPLTQSAPIEEPNDWVVELLSADGLTTYSEVAVIGSTSAAIDMAAEGVPAGAAQVTARVRRKSERIDSHASSVVANGPAGTAGSGSASF